MACFDYRASKNSPEAVNAQPLSNHVSYVVVLLYMLV